MDRKVLFICYWGLEDALTTATVLPNLHILENRPDVSRIIFITIERGNVPQYSCEKLSKIRHQPIYPRNFYFNLLSKVSDFIFIPRLLAQLIKKHKLNTTLAHGAPSGALAYKVWEKLQVPFYVSLFEPHADYMLESNVWTKYGLKYRFQKHWENLQMKYAAGFMPVTVNYKNTLRREGVAADKIFVVPCSVDMNIFNFDKQKRVSLRQLLGWHKATIGIYVGKYGDLYYKEEAFKIYKKCFKLIPDFRLIILSPQSKTEILQQLEKQSIDTAEVYIRSVPHHEVPSYLSAADFAFATYKSGSSKKYLSPIKIGEYWANGLPVLLTEGIGDDSGVIKNEGGGALFNLQEKGSVEQALGEIQEILQDPAHRQEIPKLAKKYRSPERIKEAYEYFFGQGQEVKQ